MTMRRRLSEPWTAQDDERLRTLVAQGTSPVRAAAALRRSKKYIPDRANKLVCPFPRLKDVRQKSANAPTTNGETPEAKSRAVGSSVRYFKSWHPLSERTTAAARA
jgi:hypothetical protein